MRLKRLDLTAFGPFTDRVLSFRNTATLHVVYGANESGKSSTLRALKTLFYGFPNRTPDSFLHPTNKLQVGGSFLLSDQTERDFVRWKKRKKSLTTPCGDVLEEEELRGLLAGVPSHMFERLYGLSHSQLVSGGQALLTGGGKVGESLFAANLGPEYRNLAEALKTEADALWSSRPSKKPLNECVKQWEESSREAVELSLSSEAWTQVCEGKEKADRRKNELKEQSAQMQVLLSAKRRALEAAHLVNRREELSQQLQSFAEVPDLSEDFSQRRSKAQSEWEASKHRLKVATEALERVEKSLSDLPKEADILQFSERVEALYRRVGLVTEHTLELPRMQAELDSCQSQIQTAIARLELEPTEELPELPSTAWRSRARGAAQQVVKSQEALAEHSEEMKALDQKIKALDSVSKGEEKPLDLVKVEHALEGARKAVGVDDRLQVLRSEIRTAESSLQLDLDKLSCWSGDIESLRSAKVPPATSAEQFEHDFQTLERTLEETRKELSSHQERCRRLTKTLKGLTEGDKVLTLESLAQARRERDDLWAEVYHSWRHGDSPVDAAKLLEDYTEALKQTDDMADQLRVEGERLAQTEQVQRDLKEAEEQKASSEELLTKKTAEEQSLDQRWKDLWVQEHLLLESPRHMLGWLKEREDLLTAYARIAHRKKELSLAESRLKQELKSLAQGTKALKLGEFRDERGLAGALETVEARLKELKREQAEAQQTEDKLQHLRSLRTEGKEKSERLRAERAKAQEAWNQTLEVFPLRFARKPEELEPFLLQWDELGGLLEKRSSLESRRAELQAELQSFAAEVGRLRPQLLTGQAQEEDDVRTVERARRELQAAENTENERQRLKGLVQSQKEALTVLTSACESQQQAWSQLLAEAGAEDPKSVLEVERKAHKKREFLTELRLTEDNLRQKCGNQTVQEFCEQVKSLDLDRLPTEIASLEQELSDLEQAREEQLHKAGQLDQKLQSLDGVSRAAALQQEAESAQAEGREILERLVRLRLAERLLSTQIESYRKENEGPLLASAGDYFCQLTSGAFIGIKSGYETDGEPVLLAVSKKGREVGVEGLSEGTCDQLFLALRLATISRKAKQKAVLPVVADDILVQFDSERAESTLKALLEFSKFTQVILFTHLERDYRLAESLGSDEIDLLRLEPVGL